WEKGASPEDVTPERCQELIKKAVGQPELEIEIQQVMTVKSATRVAAHFQQSRVFLVGDAAHELPSGLNSGIQGAHNLAWKLAAVLKGQASSTLLTTYEAERRPAALLKGEHWQPPGPGESGQEEKPEDIAAPPADMLDSIRYRYTSSAIVEEAG